MIFSEEAPLEDSYTRLRMSKNNFTAVVAMLAGPSRLNQKTSIRINTVTQMHDDHKMGILPEEEHSPSNCTGRHSYMDTVLL